jgi:methyl-accepting chemotaxis protein
MNTSKLTVGTRVILGFGVMVLLMVALAGVGVSQLGTLNDEVTSVANERVPRLTISYRWIAALLQTSRHMHNLLVVDKQDFPAELSHIQERKRERKECMEQLSKLVSNSEEKAALDRLIESRTRYLPDEDEFLKLAEAGDLAQAKAVLLQRAGPRQHANIDALNKLIDIELAMVKQQELKSAEVHKRGMTLLVSLSIGILALAAILSFLISSGITSQIAAAIQHIQSSSTELQAAATQQVSGAKGQVTASTEVATTVKELVSASRQIAESAQRVTSIASETAAAAKAGESTVEDAHAAIHGVKRQVDRIVVHMLELGKKSQEIGGILDIINELAEQTNILAINATIEAAGAGESGRRFAVVADEIRKLADRVGGSTKDIRGLIEEIRASANTTVMATEDGAKAVDAGTRQFQGVASSFKQIVEYVGNTADASREIELSTKQQTTAVEQVSAAMGDVAQTARESESSSAQTLQTAAQLATLSRQLTSLIQRQASA